MNYAEPAAARRRITKVREFQQLARLAEADGHLQQRIKQLLKLSKEKWDAACEHAKTAVQARASLPLQPTWFLGNTELDPRASAPWPPCRRAPACAALALMDCILWGLT